MRMLLFVFSFLFMATTPALAETECEATTPEAIDTLLKQGMQTHETVKNFVPTKRKKVAPPQEYEGMKPCTERASIILAHTKNDALMKTVLQVVVSYQDSSGVFYADTLATLWSSNPAAVKAGLKDLTEDERKAVLISLRNGWMDIRPQFTESMRAARDSEMNALERTSP